MKEKYEKKENKKNEVSANSNKTLKKIPTRGRIFQGAITKKFAGRIVLEFDRFLFIPKYERYLKKKTRIHARLPESIHVEIGDLVRVQECRPLSKMIHFIVIDKIASKSDGENKK